MTGGVRDKSGPLQPPVVAMHGQAAKPDQERSSEEQKELLEPSGEMKIQMNPWLVD